MGRVMALDVGERRIGVAVSDELGCTAQPLEILERGADDLERIGALAGRWSVERIVVGLPLRTDGARGPEAQAVEEFARRLQEKTGYAVKTWDERFTTVAAERALLEGGVSRRRRRVVRDKVAAALILQGYLDRRWGRESEG
ncbi:MAG: Holliday junction resolvase RuvX [Thermaerobacter sp.]|nr:Holliday junction resolvase RuvX [Thermaerobacter sp.]